jgi:DNA-binding YbaB/EbfC family protein
MFEGIDFSKINLNDMMGQVSQMAQKVKEEGAKQSFTAKVGGGMISITINGNSEVTDLQIDDSLLEDKDSLMILLISAINDVLKQSDEFKKQSTMNMVMNGMNSFKGNS